jgi:hypothetical protein
MATGKATVNKASQTQIPFGDDKQERQRQKQVLCEDDK